VFVEDHERQALRATVAEIARSYGHAYFAENARSGRFPHELWRELAEGGFAGVNVAVEHGGPGGALSDLAAVAEELGRAGCPLMTLVVSPGVCAPILAEIGTAEQCRTWLAGIGTGSLRVAFAMTESEAGSNSHRLRTRAVRTERGWKIDGEKCFISGVDEAEALLVVARIDSGVDGGASGLTFFIVETDRPGLSALPIPMHVLAAERQFVVSFDGVEVPEGSLVGAPGGGLGQVFHGLNPERIISAATCLGIGRYCLDKAVAYARTRTVWDVPIGAHQAVAHPLAEAHVALESARLMMFNAAALHERGRDSGAAANMAKLSAADAAARALDAAIQTHGGNGLAVEYGLADLWGLTRMYGIAPVSREMALNHLATHALGLPRGY